MRQIRQQTSVHSFASSQSSSEPQNRSSLCSCYLSSTFTDIKSHILPHSSPETQPGIMQSYHPSHSPGYSEAHEECFHGVGGAQMQWQPSYCWRKRWLTTFWLGGAINQFAFQMSISEQWPASRQSRLSSLYTSGQTASHTQSATLKFCFFRLFQSHFLKLGFSGQ